MRLERAVLPVLGDGDGQVVGEQRPPDERVQERRHEQQRHHRRRHEGEAQRERPAGEARLRLRVLDGGQRRRRHRERVRPPRDREPAMGAVSRRGASVGVVSRAGVWLCSPEAAEEVDANDEGHVQEERHEEEGARHGVEAAVDRRPREARRRRRGDEHGVHRVERLGQRLAGRQPLVQRDEHHDGVRDADGPEELAGLRPTDPRRQDGPDEVAHHREVGRRVGHLAQPPLAAGEPLPVDLELEREQRRDERAPDGRVQPLRRHGARQADGEEHGGDRRREEEVDAHRVEVLAADGLEVEDALERVGDGHGDEHGEREQPQRDVDHRRDVQEPHRRARRQRAPQDGLAAEPQADTEAADRKPQQERPHLVLRQQDVLVVLQEQHS